jgi:hypothetical protein
MSESEGTHTPHQDRGPEKRPENRHDRPGGVGPQVALPCSMSFSAVVDRVRAEFVEMPGMALTLPQATRLWNLGVDDCRSVLDALVDMGFLMWTPQRTVMRTGRDCRFQPTANSHNSVDTDNRLNMSV